ncbi:unnamed protein product, partial [marine sediment metagenome]
MVVILALAREDLLDIVPGVAKNCLIRQRDIFANNAIVKTCTGEVPYSLDAHIVAKDLPGQRDMSTELLRRDTGVSFVDIAAGRRRHGQGGNEPKEKVMRKRVKGSWP